MGYPRLLCCLRMASQVNRIKLAVKLKMVIVAGVGVRGTVLLSVVTTPCLLGNKRIAPLKYPGTGDHQLIVFRAHFLGERLKWSG